ncbi:MAG: tRNA lysidine(34) synthetase TilS [Gammaproteobacteria bacterium]|nr:MAG: tRNA lysidine(34) synthetase TilS [Gammaproteobacteria bacterium]
MSKIMQQVLNKVLSLHCKGNIFIAFSGGLDSSVLLHILAVNKDSYLNKKIVAVHVDHGLQNISSEWAHQCEQVVRSYAILFKIIKLQVEKKPGESIELAARNARYYEFEQLLGPDDVMLFAHHADDQVETFLQQALRGAGVQGLGGIPDQRPLGEGRLFRPLLDISRYELEEYAHSNDLKWIEDPTNQQSDFDRNLLRNEIIPLLEQRWSGVKKGILRSSRLCKEASQQIDDNTNEYLDLLLEDNRLSVAKLEALGFVQQKNVIRLWIRNNNLVLPNRNRLEVGIRSLLGAAQDKNPILDWDFGIIRRYQGWLYIDHEQHAQPLSNQAWNLVQPIQLDSKYCLQVKQQAGVGLKKQYLQANNISIKYRKGGERCRPFGRQGSHELKKLMQEYKVPPWMRDCTPLIYIGDEIAVVVGCCYCEPFAEKGEGVITIAKMPAI